MQEKAVDDQQLTPVVLPIRLSVTCEDKRGHLLHQEAVRLRIFVPTFNYDTG